MRFISFLLMLYFSLLSLAPNWQGIQLLNASAFIEHYQEYQAETKEGWRLIQILTPTGISMLPSFYELIFERLKAEFV